MMIGRGVFRRGRAGVPLAILVLGLVLAGSVHPQPPAASPAGALWVATVSGLVEVSLTDAAVLLRIDDPKPVRLVAVDEASGRVWAYGNDTLVAFDASGQRLLGVPIPPAPLISLLHQALVVDPATGAVWLALGQRLHHVDADGHLLGTTSLPDLVQGLAVDPAAARLWVATRSSIAPYDAGGHRGPALNLGGRRDVESVATDGASGDIWVGLRDGLRRHQAGGPLLFEVAIGHLDHLADDGTGGLWAATLNRLRRLDPLGHVLVEHRPFADGIVITAVAADPTDQSVWVSGLLALRHIGAAGQRLAGPTMPGIILDLALLHHTGVANRSPVAGDDTATTTEDTAVTIPVLANDSDPDGDSLTVTTVTQGTRGTVTVGAGGTDVTYTPNPNTSGADAFTYTISDGRGGTATAAVAVTVTPVNDPPVAVDDAATTPEDTPVTITVLGNDTDPDGDALTIAGVTQGTNGTVIFGPTTVTYTPNANFHGADSFTYTAQDHAGATATATVRVTVTSVNDEPTVSLAADRVSGTVPLAIVFTATASDADGDTLTYAWDFGDGALKPSGGSSETHTYQLAGSFTARVTVSDGHASVAATVGITPAGDGLPPDPGTVAPPVNRTVATDLGTSTEFLYTGTNPIQTGVTPGTIEARRAAVLRGKVMTRDGAALSGAQITILNHPELGQTLSRADGMFDMAVNGGGLITVNYRKVDFLPAQRTASVPWQDFALLPEVALIPRDTQVTRIDLNAAVPMQVAQGSVMTDTDGTRRATLLIPQGTQAQVLLPGGGTQTVSTLNLRLTEYTVGPNGPAAMPGLLPPTSAYTYAVELGADEAVVKIGGKDVLLSQPIFLYVENFLGFPVGEPVPMGFYDNDRAVWVPSANGRVIGVLSVSGGLADLDTDGDGIADDGAALGITATERQQLVTLYAPGQALWRVPLTHLSSGDANWARLCDSGLGSSVPCKIPPLPEAPPTPPVDDPPLQCGASVIDCQNQILGEAARVTGTPISLHYQSDRVLGRATAVPWRSRRSPRARSSPVSGASCSLWRSPAGGSTSP